MHFTITNTSDQHRRIIEYAADMRAGSCWRRLGALPKVGAHMYVCSGCDHCVPTKDPWIELSPELAPGADVSGWAFFEYPAEFEGKRLVEIGPELRLQIEDSYGWHQTILLTPQEKTEGGSARYDRGGQFLVVGPPEDLCGLQWKRLFEG